MLCPSNRARRTRACVGLVWSLVLCAALPAEGGGGRSAPPSFQRGLRGAASEGGIAGGGCGDGALTQSTSPTVIEGENSVYCGDATTSAENSLARSFVMPASGTISCVSFGIDVNVGAAWPVEVRILAGSIAGPDSVVLLASSSVPVPAGAEGLLLTADFPPVAVIAGMEYVVELRTASRLVADGGDGGLLVLGCNNDGESAPTYIRAPLCGVDDFVPTASIGFPQSQVAMAVGFAAAPPGCAAAGDCFEAHPGPGCLHGLCCASVCAVDPACCDVDWDASCASLAVAVCGAVLFDNAWHTPALPGSSLVASGGGMTVHGASPGQAIGYAIDFFDYLDFNAAPTGVQSDLVQWDSNAVGASVTFGFDSTLGDGGKDAFTFTTVAPGTAVLTFAGDEGSCLSAGPGDEVDFWLFDDDVLVGKLTGQASGSVTVSVPPGLLPGNFTFWGFCKGKKTVTENPDGSTTTTNEWSYGLGGGLSASMVVAGTGGTFLCDSFEIRPPTARMCAPPTSFSVIAQGVPELVVGITENWDPPWTLYVGSAETDPRMEGPGSASTTLGLGVAALPAKAPIKVKPVSDAGSVGVSLTGFTEEPDGVRLLLGGAHSADFSLALDLLPDTTGACVSFSSTFLGGGFGGTVLLDPCVSCPPPFKGQWNVVGSFNGLGSGTYTLIALNEGTVVAAQAGMSGLAGTADHGPVGFGKLGLATPCYTIKWPHGTYFLSSFNDGVIPIDEIRLLAEGAPPQPPIGSIAVAATNVASIFIGDPQVTLPPFSFCPADLNGDGQVGAADLATLLGAWGSPAADLDGNGTTDAADLSVLLGAWGSCP